MDPLDALFSARAHRPLAGHDGLLLQRPGDEMGWAQEIMWQRHRASQHAPLQSPEALQQREMQREMQMQMQMQGEIQMQRRPSGEQFNAL
jgi:hypothetical protein